MDTTQIAESETEREKLLCEIFAESLNLKEPVGADESFLALGGESVSAMTVAALLQEKGLAFDDMSRLFDTPTARELAPFLIPVDEENFFDEEDELPEPTPAQWERIEKNIGWENVECVYPVTRLINESLKCRDSWTIYRLWETDSKLILPGDLKSRLTEMTAKRPALRSVFLCADEPLQVVLKKHKPEFFSVDLRALSEGENLSGKQRAYFRNLIQLDLNRPKNLEREVIFRVGLVRISETKSVLFMAYSHLLLDGIGVNCILRELTGQAEVHSDGEELKRRFLRLYRKDPAPDSEYWKNLLDGRNGMSQFPMKEVNPGVAELFPIAGGKKLYDRAAKYCEENSSTVAALIHYAFGRALMEILSTDDVCFYSAGSGRAAEDMNLAGMFVVHFPVRLRRGDSLADCKTQILSSMSHTTTWGTSSARNLPKNGESYIVLNVRIFSADDIKVNRCIELSELAENPAQGFKLTESVYFNPPETSRLRVITQADDNLQFVFLSNSRYNSVFTRKLAQEFIKEIRRIVSVE